jgi:hypothetical protein
VHKRPLWNKLSHGRLNCLRRHNLATFGKCEAGAEPGISIRHDMNAQEFSDYLSIIFPEVEQTLPEGTMMHKAVLPVQLHRRKLDIIPKITFKNPYYDSVRIVKGDNRGGWHASKIYLGTRYMFLKLYSCSDFPQ